MIHCIISCLLGMITISAYYRLSAILFLFTMMQSMAYCSQHIFKILVVKSTKGLKCRDSICVFSGLKYVFICMTVFLVHSCTNTLFSNNCNQLYNNLITIKGTMSLLPAIFHYLPTPLAEPKATADLLFQFIVHINGLI